MRVALGLKAHSGWAVLVVVGEGGVVDRRRIALADEGWQKAPYHAAEPLARDAARALVERAIASAHQHAIGEMRAAIGRERARGHEIAACAVLVLDPMPEWTVDEILAVHFRMHKAEGALFREALAKAAQACGVRLAAIHEKQLVEEGTRTLRVSERELAARLASLGASLGPPWGRDQKDAALAALIALQP